jgi:hypothetical protein
MRCRDWLLHTMTGLVLITGARQVCAGDVSAQHLVFTVRAIDVSSRSSARIESGAAGKTAKVLAAGDAVKSGNGGEAQSLQVTGLDGSPVFIAYSRISRDGQLPPGVSVVMSAPVSSSSAPPDVVIQNATAAVSIAGESSGFYVLPRIHADQVQLAVSLRREDLREGLHEGHGTNLTRVAGHLGEWLDLGGTDAQRNADATTSRMQIKVEQQQ